MPRKRRVLLLAGAGALLAALACPWWFRAGAGHGPAFVTAQVKRGDLEAFISATGTIEPEEVVDIGAQVAGVISAFGKDANGRSIDYGSAVDKDMVLVRIDDALYAAAVATGEAQVQQAKANKAGADANVFQMKAKLLQAGQDWERAQTVGPSEALSKSAYDQYRANFEVARANLAAAEAAVIQTQAAVAQAQAGLQSARINLGYCTIKSPVKGVIIDRRVNIGQTVVSSLSAPSLFLIAKDLKRVQVWVSVNEADIGSITPGAPVTFTVDAFAGRTLSGVVGKIRLNATMTQNVVTYTVEINFSNGDGALLPYLTANVLFTTGRREDVLMVPNAALRFTPARGQAVENAGRGGRGESRESAGALQGSGTIWLAEGDKARPMHVKTGLSDGAWTQIEGPDAVEGQTVILGQAAAETAQTGQSGEERSPFTPQIGRAGRPTQPAPGPAGMER
ncbi:MAG: efflux RND transporter periplasmic adaptor subunit [Desulfovibrionaceae bacterium]|nr:efflux RND transporter periplasmic adaptor subunit [Desulfovibrionaceae bacterium]MBF0513787.1 efflux RND transporter periplasmic adaptor subunit [Desulfovibrionaceae bacterium]